MQNTQKKKHLILGAGGTGGHIFPAAGTAQYFASQGYDITLLTDDRGNRFADNFKDYNIVILPAANIRTGGIITRIKSLWILCTGIILAAKTIYHIRPNAVIGFGGYPSFPAGIGAFFARVPLYIHEQNAIIGRTNKVLSLFSKKIFLSFKHTIGLENSKKTVFTGNPIRTQIMNYVSNPAQKMTDKFHLLVTGGSQGAKVFTDIIPISFGFLPKDMTANIHVTHQARPEDCVTTRELYKNQNISADVVPFIDNMGQKLSQADLVICRSGASTLSEMAVLGKTGLYVPLPTSADNQQVINASYFAKYAAGKMIEQKDLTPMVVASIITQYMKFPEKLSKSDENAKKLGTPNAAHHIFDNVQT